MTHLTMYGRGHFNRMRGVVAPPPRPVLRPYPTAQPAQPYPADDPSVVVTAIGMLGDALTEVQAAARTKVNEEAADYKLPTTPKTRSEAIMAYILLLRAAAAERPGSASFYKTQANEAAYTFRASSIPNIIYTAVGLTKNEPRTNRIAMDIYATVRGSAAAPKGVAKSTTSKSGSTTSKSGSTKLRVTTEPEPSTKPPGESWQDQLAMLPSWVPWVAGGTFVVAAAWLLLPSRKPQVAAAPASAVKP
jgi:hypothetical protein